MPEEEVSQLLIDNHRVRKRGSGVGLINVHNRIRLCFGEAYGLEIHSVPDEGTTVRMGRNKLYFGCLIAAMFAMIAYASYGMLNREQPESWISCRWRPMWNRRRFFGSDPG